MEVDREAVLELLVALRTCSRLVERGVREHDLDPLDVRILALAEAADGGLRPSHAANRLAVPFPSVTRHVQRLQRDGYLSIDPDPGDRRGYRIAVTPAGRTRLGDFRDNLAASFAPVLAGWETDEIRALAQRLARLNDAMTAAIQRTPRHTGAGNWWRADAARGRTSEPAPGEP